MERTEVADPHAWLQEFVPTLDAPRRTAIVADVVRTVLRDVPELAGPDLHEDLEALAVECLRSLMATAVLDRDTWVDPGLPVAGIHFCRTLARRGHDLVILFRLFRLGHAHFWQMVTGVAEREIADAELQRRVLAVVWDRLARWQDFLVDRLVGVYQEERERWLRGALAGRAELVSAILAGRVVDADRAEATLGHDLRSPQIAITIRSEGSAQGAGDLEAVAADLAAAVGARRALTVPAGATSLWVWIATSAPPDRAALEPAINRHPSVRVAVGRAGPGLAGFRAGHREALAAQRAANLLRRRRPLTRYEDVELLALLSAEPEAMHRFVAVHLAGLAAQERLCRTALAILRAGGNHTAAAAALGVHRNTVRNHRVRAEQLLGRALSTTDVHLHLALVLAVDATPVSG